MSEMAEGVARRRGERRGGQDRRGEDGEDGRGIRRRE
jgi:hypothetical protein